MSENERFLPARTDTIGLQTGELAPVHIGIDRIRSIVHQTELPTLTKRRLIKQEIKAAFELRKAQIRAALEVEEMKLEAGVQLAKKATAAYAEGILLQIREGFLKTYGELGRRLERQQRELLTSFAEEVDAFQKDLDAKNISPRYKQRITESVDRSFDRLEERLEDLTSDIILEASGRRDQRR
jgi:hypothetical protein